MSFDDLKKPESGFTLIELALVLVLFAALAVIAVPRFEGVLAGSSLDAAAREIAGDLRQCRSLAVSQAATNPAGFALRLADGAQTYELVDLATSTAVADKELPCGVERSGDAEFRFTPLGSLGAGSGSALTLTRDGRSVTVTVVSATGAVLIAEE